MDIESAAEYFTGLQDRIVGRLEAIDGTMFGRDSWQRDFHADRRNTHCGGHTL